MKKSTIYGIHTVTSAITKQASYIEQLYVVEGVSNKRIQALLEVAKKANLNMQLCSKAEADHMVGDVNHQGVVALILAKQFHEKDIDHLLDSLEEEPFILILDGVQDPHNLGACLRTANASGVHLVIAPKDNAVSLTSSVRKVASGAAESTPYIQVTNLSRTLRKLKDRGVWLYGLSESGQKSIYEMDLSGARALVLGAEGAGLRRLTAEHCDVLLRIPLAGDVESLNVSVAAGICLFECVRQSLL